MNWHKIKTNWLLQISDKILRKFGRCFIFEVDCDSWKVKRFWIDRSYR